jgi:hypothetical protein
VTTWPITLILTFEKSKSALSFAICYFLLALCGLSVHALLQSQ